MRRSDICLYLGPADRAELQALIANRKTPRKLVWRAGIVLATADGHGTFEIMRRTGMSKPTVWRWQERYLDEGVPGLKRDETRPSRVPPLPIETRLKVITKTVQESPPNATHWSRALMAEAMGISPSSVGRIWADAGLKPHIVKGFKVSNDPLFEEKVTDIVGLYLDPPDRAVVLCVDEKSQIQALDRTQPGLPLKKGRTATMTHDYKRHVTTTFFAALDVKSGKVIGDCMPRHRAKELLKFLRQINKAVPARPGPNFGIDFTGGVQMVLRSDAPVPLAELRAAIDAGVPGDASLQAFGDPNEALIRVQGEAGQATVAAVEAAAAQAVPGAVFDQIDLVGPTISGELATTGLIALSLAVLAMLAYIWVRFEWHFAAGAIAVLFLDITKTFGVIAVTGWEVNLTTIVALLTLIGYSVNDKVVVYDRIREHRRSGGGDVPLSEVIDRSLNQVLARCIFTSGTTLAALLPMAIWGGPAVAGFAWPMIAGVVIATGSSLFVSGPVLAWLAARSPSAMSGPALTQAGYPTSAMPR